MSDRRLSTPTLYRRLLQQARPFWGHIAGTLGLNLLGTPLKLLSPLPLAIAVDSVLGDKPLPGWIAALLPNSVEASTSSLLWFAVGLAVAVGVLAYANAMLINLLHSYTGQRLTLAFRSTLFRHAQRLSLQHHDTHGSADATYRIQYDAPSIQWIALDGIIPFVSSGFLLIGMIAVTARLDWELALVAMGVLPVLFIMTRVWSNRLRQQWSEAKKLESSAMGVVQETVSALRVVKAFGQEDREHGRFVNHATAGMWGQVKVAVSQGLFELAVGVVITGGTAAVLYIGVKHVMDGTLSVGELLIIMGYVTQLYGPLQIVANKITTLQGAIASADRAFTLLDTAPDLVEKPHATRIERAEGAFTFENVSFAYREGEPVLQDVSFAVEPGMKVGIVGPTGAGKSTLLNLLTRSYDPTAGRVLMDGRDIRDYRLADLREQFGIVLQEPLLFATTLGDNIAYARPDADAGSIEQAARAADAHGFITRLPDGYLTEVGERGASLSGGERQRVSLARAFLKDAPVLILDEPTSAVDVKTETAIIGALERLMEGRTTFMIAHRLSTLRSCDLLLTVQDGRVTRVDDDVEAALAAKEQDAVK